MTTFTENEGLHVLVAGLVVFLWDRDLFFDLKEWQEIHFHRNALL